MNYFCCDEQRRNAVKGHPTLNGIDFLEVLDNQEDAYEQRQTTLLVHFIKALTPGSLSKQQVLIEGGERIRPIKVVEVTAGSVGSPPFSSPPFSSPPIEQAHVLVVKVAEPGDFSMYTLRLVQDEKHQDPPAGFDPILSVVDFSFKVACPNDFDCKPQPICEKEPVQPPIINYLAKDYGSFRQLMLDRMTLLLPQWKERNPADLGSTLVELLAYVGDYLSYQQDAVATEAYIGTARKRVSVRRHARLVDYFMHDGCNARAWVQIQVSSNFGAAKLEKGEGSETTKLLTRVNELPTVISLTSPEYQIALDAGAQIFELMHDSTLHGGHNEMSFYTWGEEECCLPKGATRATLLNHFPDLKPGQVLILSEVRDPQTGMPGDADPAHRHPVRLTKVTLSYDPLGNQAMGSPPNGSPPDEGSIPVTEIEWYSSDALPFPLCISSRSDTQYFKDVSVVLGNIVLVDHGQTIQDKLESSLIPDTVPESKLVFSKSNSNPCEESQRVPIPPRFRPKLKRGPLTHAAPYDLVNPPASASAALHWSMRSPKPAITLRGQTVTAEQSVHEEWVPRRDLLSSGAQAKEFVVEVESDGIASLRFGDNKQGSRPATGTQWMATYRVGNGVLGNIGAKTLAHIVSKDPVINSNEIITKIWNPLPAFGGVEPEAMELVRQKAPYAFRTQERAVTPEDYEAVAKRCDQTVQRAAGTFRWTGSWRTAFLSVDRLAGQEVSEDFENGMRDCLERYRMAGHDVEVDGPRYVSLEIEMIVCVKPGYFASDVKSALLDVFSNRMLANGRRGVFHPDNFTFGQTVYLSPFYAAAQATQGVDSVHITKFKRQGDVENDALDTGKLLLGRLEIARLDNDPNFREQGVFTLIMKGGR